MLTIYRASAGSGKTYTLTGEYLKLVFGSRDAFRHTLAVTFTNKATAEMKDRVVKELYALADGQKADHLTELTKSRNEKQVREMAKKILSVVLNDYSSFNISTIDHFFQQTVRAFCREIGLQGGYEIEMEEDTALVYAIDNLLVRLDLPENKALLLWLENYAQRKMQEGKTWNFRKDMESLGKLIFHENFRLNSRKLQEETKDIKALDDYRNLLNTIIRNYEQELKEEGQKAVDLIEHCGLTLDDFFYKSSSAPSFFYKIVRNFDGALAGPKDRFSKMVEDPSSIVPKSANPGLRASILSLMENGLSHCAEEILALFDAGNPIRIQYLTAQVIRENFSIFCILNNLSREVARYRDEKNVMLISDTSSLLSQVINGSETPFIYERIGTTLNSFMIDEFQDTSRQQWSNFLPLLSESLSRNQDNLIVGDVKQSIYRFRNSDWELLQTEVNNDIPSKQLRSEVLDVNWRSCRHIVEFNNALFAVASRLMQQLFDSQVNGSTLTKVELDKLEGRIVSAYADSFQSVSKDKQNKEGRVSVNFIVDDKDKGGWRAEAQERLPKVIAQLQDDGFALKDIAVLVRKNDEAALLAQSLLSYAENHPEDTHRYDIISNEALVISGSAAVRLIIAFMRWIVDRGNENQRRFALCSWLVAKGTMKEKAGMTDFPDDLKRSVDALTGSSLYETAEGLYRLFSPDFSSSEQAYLLAFLDMVSEYATNETPDINGFLQWWDDTGYKKNISTPDDQDAVTITTIHKSKGLGFKAVIVPFCDWDMDGRDSVLLCTPKVAPFNQFSLLPVNYSSKLASTIFAPDYFKEMLYNFVDNLNDLYVAFTRAKEELIVFAKDPGDKESKNRASQLLWDSIHHTLNDEDADDRLIKLSEYFNEEEKSLQLGESWTTENETQHMPDIIRPVHFTSVSYEGRLHLSLNQRDLFATDKQRRRGAILHELLSHIETREDIEPAVQDSLQQGIIDEELANHLRESLDKLLKKPEAEGWFDGSTHVLNETDILSKGDQKYRPDRVMIDKDKVIVLDYKFGKEEKSYDPQVRNYVNLIRTIGYKNVEGYLWYVESDRIEKVND